MTPIELQQTIEHLTNRINNLGLCLILQGLAILIIVIKNWNRE